MTTEQMLLKVTGGWPVMSVQQLADMLQTSVNSIHISLGRDTTVSRTLNPYKRKIGRRIYFEIEGVAKLIKESGH